MTDRMKVKAMLEDNHLTQQWLLDMLNKRGMRVQQSEVSSALSARRTGPKYETLIQESLMVIGDYMARMGIHSA